MSFPAAQVAIPHDDLPRTGGDSQIRLAHLQQAIQHAAHLLPAQGPITVFIHHNTLHAFEDLPFDEGVRQGGRIFGCQPYLSEDRYRQAWEHERILTDDLRAVLREELGPRADQRLPRFDSRIDLRLAMLQHPIRLGPPGELRWFVAETDALTRLRSDVSHEVREHFVKETRHWVMRDVRAGRVDGPSRHPTAHDQRIHEALAGLLQHFGESTIERWSDSTWEAFALQALWRACREGVHGVRSFRPARHAHVRHRDVLLEATGEDIDPLVNDVLIRFCAAFLDQGFSHWPLPHREDGFFRAFSDLYRQQGGPPEIWQRGLAAELTRLEVAHVSPLESILESLECLGVEEHEWDEFVSATLLALRGWAGMIQQVVLRADSVAHPAPPDSLTEYLAIRLVLERLALAHVARQALKYAGPLRGLRHTAQDSIPRHESASVDQRAFLVFQLAQVLGWLPVDLFHLTKDEWSVLVEEIEAFSEIERRRVFHHAFERRYRIQTLDAIATNSTRSRDRVPSPRFQAITCLDEREESFRRHLEEIAPDVETFGAAGFFSVAMYYRGAADAHFVPLCPIVIRPQHWIVEDVVYTLEESHRRRAKTRRAIGTASHQFHVGSRGFWGGALLATGLGALASIPLVTRTLFPRLTSHIRRTASRLLQPPPITQLRLERTGSAPGTDDDRIGFSVEEMATIGERLLRDIGLTSGFARLVIVIGHGSNSLNNPHKSAYECGACGGGAGGPNARALAQILNDVRVRMILSRHGIQIPHETVFVGGFHNTCNDSVTFLELERLPKSHHADFDEARRLIEMTCDRNAHERCRRFMSAPLTMSFAEARRHVEARAEDLSQARPECGHATNAVCFVGRRSRSRGLYMDRRCFLTSYDPAQDDAESPILTRILQAVFPVCAGINLEYYFSYVDSPGYGCSTKLPHNVTSLLGVMDGAASDLRTGLPWQMVEIHEPVRLLFVVETTPDAMLRIMERNEAIGKLVRNGWVQVAVLSPESSALQVYQHGKFEVYQPETTELPRAASSTDWYRGWRDHLRYAQIESVSSEPAETTPEANHV
jgi:uncharacterized protein YbcC (UPF0753/DUF2309 family)